MNVRSVRLSACLAHTSVPPWECPFCVSVYLCPMCLFILCISLFILCISLSISPASLCPFILCVCVCPHSHSSRVSVWLPNVYVSFGLSFHPSIRYTCQPDCMSNLWVCMSMCRVRLSVHPSWGICLVHLSVYRYSPKRAVSQVGSRIVSCLTAIHQNYSCLGVFNRWHSRATGYQGQRARRQGWRWRSSHFWGRFSACLSLLKTMWVGLPLDGEKKENVWA